MWSFPTCGPGGQFNQDIEEVGVFNRGLDGIKNGVDVSRVDILLWIHDVSTTHGDTD